MDWADFMDASEAPKSDPPKMTFKYTEPKPVTQLTPEEKRKLIAKNNSNSIKILSLPTMSDGASEFKGEYGVDFCCACYADATPIAYSHVRQWHNEEVKYELKCTQCEKITQFYSKTDPD